MNATAFPFRIGFIFAGLLLAFSGPFDRSAAAQGGNGFAVPGTTQSNPLMPGSQEPLQYLKKNEDFQKNVDAASKELRQNLINNTFGGAKKIPSTVNYFYYAAIGVGVLAAVVVFSLIVIKPRSAKNTQDLALTDPWIRSRLEMQNSSNGGN